MMKGSIRMAVTILALCGAGSVLADDRERKVPIRNFDRFEMDAGTASGVRLEILGFYDSRSGMRSLDTIHFEERADRDVDVVTGEARLSFGGKKLELGAVFPYYWVDDIRGSTPDQQDVGDVRAYLKLIPIRSEWVDAGAGYDITFDSGEVNDGFGYGEVGHLPFATATLHLAPVHINLHAGYRFFNHVTEPQVAESLVYGGAVHLAFADNFAIRTEFAAQEYDVRGKKNPESLSVQPGVDILLPFDGVDIIFRPSGSIGLNHQTSDWGAGASLLIGSPFPQRPIIE